MSAGESSGEQHDATARGNFPQTRWSLVASVRERGERELAAMEELCRVYWPPLYAFARRGGISPEDAADRVQGFFCKVIEKDYFGDADAERGKLRTFLLAAFKHYTANQRKHDHAQRRGGGKRQWLSIDAMEAEMVLRRLAGQP
ncbi:MAG: hypothetical protein O3C21_03080 [Verrucomicrobia bacterium]|nr:hypothetical protein [Verrucomicrobiota bacterium]